jgi:hypothetical protein
MTNTVVVSNDIVNVISVGQQGPPGPAGSFAPVLMGNLFMQSAANLSVPLVTSAQYPFTITGLNGLKAGSGTITLTIQVNGVNVTGLTALAVNSTVQNPVTSDATAQVAIGDSVVMILFGGTIASNLQFTMAASTTT